MFDMVFELMENPFGFEHMQYGDRYGEFHLIYHEIEEELVGKRYNPCEEFHGNQRTTSVLKKAMRRFAKFSGPNGDRSSFKDFTPRVGGVKFIGGDKGVQIAARHKYARKQGCGSFRRMRISPEEYRLYNKKECDSFFAGKRPNRRWAVKPVDGFETGGIKIFSGNQAGLKSLKDAFVPGGCRKRDADYVVQELVEPLIRVRQKQWAYRAYMLVACTAPWMARSHFFGLYRGPPQTRVRWIGSVLIEFFRVCLTRVILLV